MSKNLIKVKPCENLGCSNLIEVKNNTDMKRKYCGYECSRKNKVKIELTPRRKF